MSNHSTLPAQVVQLLLALADAMGEQGIPLASQASAAKATAYSATYIDVRVPDSAVRGEWRDGPLDIKPLVVNELGEPIGEVLVWVNAGRMTLLEQAWFTDDPPTDWPTLDLVRIK
jgi:hypothetical protein